MYKHLLFCLLIVSTTISVSAQHQLNVLETFDDIKVSKKNYDEVKQAFDILKNAPLDFFDCKARYNNCENRSAFTIKLLNKLGFEAINFWLFKEKLIKGQAKSDALYYTPSGCKRVSWGYHVAGGVIINNGDKIDTLVLDPWTQNDIKSLNDWATSFYLSGTKRTAFVMLVLKNYYFYPTDKNKLKTDKDSWVKYIDEDEWQMYCGLSGITPNKKCAKAKFRDRISSKKSEINNYLEKYHIAPLQ